MKRGETLSRVRRMAIWAVCGCLVLALSLGVGFLTYNWLSSAEVDQATPHWVPETAEPSQAPTTHPTSQQEVHIKRSMPTELYFPQLEARLSDRDKHLAHIKLDNTACPIDAWNHVQPDLSHMDQACVAYRPGEKDWSAKLQLPGTDNDGQVVMFGHTWRQGAAAFNLLYDWQAQRTMLRAGDEMWVKTEASGNRWLVYTYTGEMRTPAKPNLSSNQWAWPEKPHPGRLLTIGCRQPDNLGIHSYENLVFEWMFSRVDTR